MRSCVCCGQPLPSNQGSRTCSMCFGDPDHGKDGYYQAWLEEQERQTQRRQERTQPPEDN